MLIPILIGSFAVSLVAFTGVLVLILKPETAKRFSFYFISFAAGTLLGVVFLDLLPEAAELAGNPESIFWYVLIGFLIFFILERSLIWYHCHGTNSHPSHRSQSATLILIGDAVHNLIDGVIIAIAFIADFKLGILTTISVALHEVPQEIGDFSVLIYGGMKRLKALVLNTLVAFTTVIGAIGLYLFAGAAPDINALLVPALAMVAGGFIYISAVDLIPELHHETRTGQIFMTSALFFLGIAAIYLVGQILPHQ
ncbi:MAG: ZIP family metal transporter [Patescibacteria group bacterium]